MSDSNTVWIITREDSVDLNPHIAVFDSAVKAKKSVLNKATVVLKAIM